MKKKNAWAAYSFFVGVENDSFTLFTWKGLILHCLHKKISFHFAYTENMNVKICLWIK